MDPHEPPEVSKRIQGSKSVNFAAFNEVQDTRGTIKSSKSLALGTKSGASFRQSFTGKGNASSRAAAKRRRFWRKLRMRFDPRYWVHVANKKLPIIHPNVWYRVAWDLFVLILVLYNAIIVPYQVGFSTPRPDILTPLNYAIDIIFAMDICFNFRTAYFDRSASLVRDGRRIFVHYSKTWFPVDLIATIPYEGIVFISPAQLDDTEERLIGLLRLPRLLRLARLLRFFDRLRGANYVRMVKLTMALGFVAHWIACGWRFVYELTVNGQREWTYDRLGDGSAEISYFLQGYINAYLTMIGNDVGLTNDVERAYAVFMVVGGACFYAIVIGNMSVLVNSLNPTASRHKFKKDMVANTVRYLDIPSDTQTRINEYFEYLTTYRHPGPEAISLLGQLPVSMFHDITNWMFFDIVKKVPLFEGCEDAFLAQLVMRLKLGVFLPGEIIFHIGDVGHEMYFITKGHVAVMNTNMEMLALLGKGGFFGELALLATARRTARCTALANCDLACLKAHDLVAAMRGFPETAAKVRERAMGRLTRLQAAGTAGAEPHVQEVPWYLKKLNPEAAREAELEAEREKQQGLVGGGSKLSANKLEHHQHQLNLMEAQRQAHGTWRKADGTLTAEDPPLSLVPEDPSPEEGGAEPRKPMFGVQNIGGAARMALGLKGAGQRAKSRLALQQQQQQQQAEEEEERARAQRVVQEGELCGMDDWTLRTMALVEQAHGTMGSISGRVDGLHAVLEDLHGRLEKVETAGGGDEDGKPDYDIFESGLE